MSPTRNVFEPIRLKTLTTRHGTLPAEITSYQQAVDVLATFGDVANGAHWQRAAALHNATNRGGSVESFRDALVEAFRIEGWLAPLH